MSLIRRPRSGRPRYLKKSTCTANCFIGRYPGISSTFTTGPCVSRTIRKHLTEGNLGSLRSLRVLLLTPTDRRLRLKWCRTQGNWTAAEWDQIVFSNESRFRLSSDDNFVRVWRSRGKFLNQAFALQQHTAPTAGVMVWGTIA
ncbi:transposable element Tcb2 transposase [Trichonephila clavipes]|nr:transposable element Tcb2 transposase [Trichonephila clavipes]